MPLILEREHVLDVYSETAAQKWVLPAFNSENLTTTEAILQAAKEYGQSVGVNNLPIIIGITNKYPPRPQSIYYTHTRQWHVGLRLFLSDLKVLTSDGSPFESLRVMIHLDHICWDQDEELQTWDMRQFSSIMYDASSLSFEQNIRKTAAFVKKNGNDILIEGACDEIAAINDSSANILTTPEMAEKYYHNTGVDIIVANLGTEHRASAATLQYHGELARQITKRIGPRLCLHGTSSVSLQQVAALFDDGIRKVNVWTVLERNSSSALFQDMLQNVSMIVGPDRVKELVSEGLLGKNANSINQRSINYFTTAYRQEIVFQRMKEIITEYLSLWYH
jgi:fructose-bisphosphate aldolase class II